MYIYIKNERRKWLERVSRNSYRERIIVAKREIFNGRSFTIFQSGFKIRGGFFLKFAGHGIGNGLGNGGGRDR